MIPYLGDGEDVYFPPIDQVDDSGVLAWGGNLSPQTLVKAYLQGIFPWYNKGEPILWWSPDPRMVLLPENLKVSKSMRPYFNQPKFKLSYNTAFREVMLNCATRKETWIHDEIVDAYCRLHAFGFAHSVEVWRDSELVGGLYGVKIGAIFFGESMFSTVSNASKFGFISLVKKLQSEGIMLIDCQQETKHLRSLGATPISQREFSNYINLNKKQLVSSP